MHHCLAVALAFVGVLHACRAANECYVYTCIQVHAEEDNDCTGKFESERKTMTCPVESSCLKRITNVGGNTAYLYSCADEKKEDEVDCTKRVNEDMMECFCNDDLCNAAASRRFTLSSLLAALLATFVLYL